MRFCDFYDVPFRKYSAFLCTAVPMCCLTKNILYSDTEQLQQLQDNTESSVRKTPVQHTRKELTSTFVSTFRFEFQELIV